MYSGGGTISMNGKAPLPSLNRKGFRLTTVNQLYGICRSYPAAIIVPFRVTDESIKKVARGHKHARFPAITWISEGGAMLVRCGGFQVKSGLRKLANQAQQSTQALPRPADAIVLKTRVEQEKYFLALTQLSPGVTTGINANLASSRESLLSLDSLLLSSLDSGSTAPGTPDLSLRNTVAFNRNLGSVRSSGGKSGKSVASSLYNTLRLGSSGTRFSPASYANTLAVPSYAQRRLSSQIPGKDSHSSQLQALNPAALYILGERAQAKAIRLDKDCEFIPLEYPDVRDAKIAFKKLLRATAPAAVSADPAAYLFAVEESGWLSQVAFFLRVASDIASLVDIQCSSCVLALEEGWDITCILSSLAQLLLDPNYRTLEGFRVLIEKEWLAFGHRFSKRCNHTQDSQGSGFAPIFMLFLDAVHQLLHQFPYAFEFNDFYLRFLAYHSVACYYRTFVLDCESDRIEAGLIPFVGRPALKLDSRGGGSPASSSNSNPPTSIWEAIEKIQFATGGFRNFAFAGDLNPTALQPSLSAAALDLWCYYLEDPLAVGSAYDLDAATVELRERDSDKIAESLGGIYHGLSSDRKVIDLSYHDDEMVHVNSYRAILEDIRQLEHSLNRLPRHWEKILADLAASKSDEVERQILMSELQNSWDAWLNRSLHKRSTVELLLRGKSAIKAVQNLQQQGANANEAGPHNFQPYYFSAPVHCDYCKSLLWGIMKQGVRCATCNYSCHEKCANQAPNTCRMPSVPDDSNALENRPNPMESNPTAAMIENRTHEGYLYKRSSGLVKMWKSRWFVLDEMRHQLRYYDEMRDSQCKNWIDLGNVTNVALVPPVASMPKRDGACFELRTTDRRNYIFMANDRSAAQEWIEKIQKCLTA